MFRNNNKISIQNNVFSIDEINTWFLQHQDVLSSQPSKQNNSPSSIPFSIPCSIPLFKRLQPLGLNIQPNQDIPMRWVSGPVPPHIDRGKTDFLQTSLIYLSGSGQMKINGDLHEIEAGKMFQFTSDIEHEVIVNANNDVDNNDAEGAWRLMLGPMNEVGLAVGANSINYYPSESEALDQSFSYPPVNVTFAGTPIIAFPASDPSYSPYFFVPANSVFLGWNKTANSSDDGFPLDHLYLPGDTTSVSDTFLFMFPVFQTIPIPVSNICFPANTPVLTDQHGPIAIQLLQSGLHTIHGQHIEIITKTIAPPGSYMVEIDRFAFGAFPLNKIQISPHHRILYRGSAQVWKEARELIGHVYGVRKIPYHGDALYNVLLKNGKHGEMDIHGLTVETLHPNNLTLKVLRDKSTGAKIKLPSVKKTANPFKTFLYR